MAYVQDYPEDRPRSGRRVLILTLAAIAVIAVAIFGGRKLGLFGGGAAAGPGGPGGGAGGPPGGMPPMPVDADTARRGTVVDAVRATGRIEAVNAVELRPDEPGRIVELLFREGQQVATGRIRGIGIGGLLLPLHLIPPPLGLPLPPPPFSAPPLPLLPPTTALQPEIPVIPEGNSLGLLAGGLVALGALSALRRRAR